MKNSSEIKNNLDNIKYYAENIKRLAKEQFEEDAKRGNEIGINTGPGSIRFSCLAAIYDACSEYEVYDQHIRINLETADAQGKLLYADMVEDSEH
jgi:hypothetical protein